MTENTTPAAKTSEPIACACSRFDALDPEQLTDGNLENGNYDIWTTGCTASTRNTFAPGHDAKLKSFLIKHAVQGHEIRETFGGTAVSREAVAHAAQFGFSHMVLAGIAKATERTAEKVLKRAAKAAAKRQKAERKLAEKAGVVKPLAAVVAEEEAAHRAAEVAKVAEREASADWSSEGTDLTEEPEVIAKVGRWEYRGIEKNGTFYYLAKDGHTHKETTKYQVVRPI